MQHDQTELRARTDGERVVGPDGYHHVTPESRPAEYRRAAGVASEQQAPVRDRPGGLIAGRGRE